MTYPIEAEPRANLAFRQDLEDCLQSENYSPEELVCCLEIEFSDEFDHHVGIPGGFTLREHTLMALHQFEKYFAGKPLPADTDSALFRVILALHDVGKPAAIRNGDKRQHHEPTVAMADSFLERNGFSDQERTLACGVIGGDTFGRYIIDAQRTLPDFAEVSERTAREIRARAEQCDLTAIEFLDLLAVYYQVDAGSYTSDAGDRRGYLNHLFIFRPEAGQMTFTPNIQKLVESLRGKVLAEDAAAARQQPR